MGVAVNIDTNASDKSQTAKTSPNTPFCIAILGDFSGRTSRSQHAPETLKSRRLIEIDRDNFEQVMARFNISLNIKLGTGDAVQLAIKELDDFHPDELYEKLETFSQLRSLRRRLNNRQSFAEAAAEIQSWNPLPEAAADQSTEQTQAQQNVLIQADGASFLDSILDAHQSSSNTSTSQIEQLIKSVVAPYVIAAADPRQDAMIASVDQATQSHMRDILHQTDFQALESAWQSLYFLIKRLETDSTLNIKILDVTKQELLSDLAVDDLTTSAIYKLLCDAAEGESPYSVLLGNYSFSDSIDDVLALAAMGEIAQQAGAPFIAAASETLAGCESFAATPDYADWSHSMSEGVKSAWQMLRESSIACYVGLALPRFLVRLPYGLKTKSIDSFAFEEMPDEPCHECYLWGNAAFIKVELLARNFKNRGWSMQPGEEYQTDSLPLHYYQQDGETLCKPVAEILLTEKGGEIISQQGLMPLWSVNNSDAIRSSDFRSVAENGQTIVGRWAARD